MQDFMTQIKGWFAKLSPGLQRQTLVWGAIALALLGGGLWWALQPRWATLYSGLDQKDANAVVEKLKENKIPYKLDGGGTVMVPDDKVYEQRLALAGAGLPQGGGQGYELLDKGNTFGLSEEAARINGIRALQGELERTIGTLQGVDGVRVHLVVPERRLFARERPPASASVVLKLKTGRGISDEEAAGVVYLVSHAVEGLAPENVALLDNQGRALAEVGQGAGFGVGSRVESVRKVEKYLREKAQSLMDEALGAGEAIVRVNAELDFTSSTITREVYTAPNGQQGLVRQQDTQSSSAGGTTAGAARPGTLSVNSENPVAQPLQGTQNSSSSNSSTRYELNRSVENVSQGAGNVKKLTVTLLLKNPLPAADLALLKDAVAGAVGINPARGDTLSVASVPAAAVRKPEPVDAKAEASTAGREEALRLARMAAPWATALVIALLGFLALSKLTGAIRTAGTQAAMAAQAAQVPSHAASTGSGLKPGMTQQEIAEMARRNPASAAAVIRRWMN